MTQSKNSKVIIGNKEWCSFPDLGVPAIKARIDSGAKTSSIHAFNIQKIKRNGQTWVSFELYPIQNNRKVVIRCEKPVIDVRKIRSSSGYVESRYVIKATLKLGEDNWDVELTLANRDTMGFRMLLGREAMANRMIVDPSLSYCLGDFTNENLDEFYQNEEKTFNGLKIAIMASNPDLYSNLRLVEAAEERGHQVEFLNIKQCYLKLDAIEPEVHYRGGKVLNQPDAVITRIRPSITFYGTALARQFESLGVLTVNTSSSITQSRDKLYALQQMVKNGINVPITGFASSPSDTDDLINMVEGAPLIIKLLEGSQGRGVVLAETKKAAASVINAFKSVRANLLVQKFIKEADGKDLRCFVIGNKVVASMQREAAPGDFRANIHLGGKASVVKITPEERALALKAAKILGLSFAGVDIIRSKDGPQLLEVNSSPGLEGIETATGKDIAGMMIAFLEKKLRWKRELNN